MANICIIGGSGFLGSRLISQLKNKHLVLNVDIAASQQHPECTVFGDVRERATFERHLAGKDIVVLLAAVHRDDIHPASQYYDVNVEGIRNVLAEMNTKNIQQLVFTSTVAVYGMNQPEPPKETSRPQPFNHYSKSKWEAEQAVRHWLFNRPDRSALILRPAVIFGEDNRGNVYELAKKICAGKFVMIGNGRNRKSMAYVGNVAAFIEHRLRHCISGEEVFNYADKPDFDMNTLVREIHLHRGHSPSTKRVPYAAGIFGGYCCDALSRLTGKNFPISAVRIRKFCSSTAINCEKLAATDFHAPFNLIEALHRTLNYEFAKSNLLRTAAK